MGQNPKVEFQPNVPVELSLHFPEGKIIEGRFGQSVMYSLDFPHGHVMFLDLAVAQKINMLEIVPGEHFFVCKRPKNGSVPARWDIWLSPATEQMRAQRENTRSITEPASEPASFLERQLAASIHEAQTRKAPQSAGALAPPPSTGTHGPVPVPRPAAAPAPPMGSAPQWAGVLEAKANALVDVYAACLDRGLKEHGGRVKPEEIRALLTTVYIAMTRSNGASNAA